MSTRVACTTLKIGSKTITSSIKLIDYSRDYKDVELTDELRIQEEQKFELMRETLKGKMKDIYLSVFERLNGLGSTTKEIQDLMKWAVYLEIEKMDDRQKTRKWLYPNETGKDIRMAPVLGIRTEMSVELSTKEKYRLKRQVDYEAHLKQLENRKITNVEMKKYIKGIINDEDYSHSRQPVSVYPMDQKSQIERLVATAAVFQSKENEDTKPHKVIKQELKHFYGKNSHMPADRAQKAIRRRKKIYNERLAEFQKNWYP